MIINTQKSYNYEISKKKSYASTKESSKEVEKNKLIPLKDYFK